jgi:hypothetical protein
MYRKDDGRSFSQKNKIVMTIMGWIAPIAILAIIGFGGYYACTTGQREFATQCTACKGKNISECPQLKESWKWTLSTQDETAQVTLADAYTKGEHTLTVKEGDPHTLVIKDGIVQSCE